MIQTRQQLIKSTIGSKTITFATRDISGPPPTLNVAVKGQPEAYIVDQLCVQSKLVLVYREEPAHACWAAWSEKLALKSCVQVYSHSTLLSDLAQSFTSDDSALISPL
jgi:hypothetical protein